MRSVLFIAISLSGAFSAILAERQDEYGEDDELVGQVAGFVHASQERIAEALSASVTGAPFDDATLTKLELPDPDQVESVTARFVLCGHQSAILLHRRLVYGHDDAVVQQLAPVVHAEQQACFALLTAQPASA